MELHDYTIHLPKREVISICPFADLHIGSATCNLTKFKEFISWVKSQKYIYLIGVGDYIEAINLSDKRFDPDMVDADYRDCLGRLVQKQAETLVDILTPVKHKIIGLGVGNHEEICKRRYYYDVMYTICGQLGVKYLGWSSITRLRLIRDINSDRPASRVVTLFAEHSSFSGRKKGSKVNRMEDRSNEFEADIYIYGHSHDKVATTKTYIYVPKNGELRLAAKKRVYCIVPSYFNAYEEGVMSYAEVKGFPPTSTGALRIDILMKKSHDDDYIDYHIYQ